MEFFENGHLLQRINHTLINLIPKGKQIQRMRDLRPIGLCDVIYKIISKILTRHLQPFMNVLIGQEQSAFTKGRLISDNILLYHKIMHYIKNKIRGRDYYMALKLDISKAYDSVEWDYL